MRGDEHPYILSGRPRSKSRTPNLTTYRQCGPMGQSAPSAARYLESAAAGPLAGKKVAWFCAAARLALTPPLRQL